MDLTVVSDRVHDSEEEAVQLLKLAEQMEPQVKSKQPQRGSPSPQGSDEPLERFPAAARWQSHATGRPRKIIPPREAASAIDERRRSGERGNGGTDDNSRPSRTTQRATRRKRQRRRQRRQRQQRRIRDCRDPPKFVSASGADGASQHASEGGGAGSRRSFSARHG